MSILTHTLNFSISLILINNTMKKAGNQNEKFKTLGLEKLSITKLSNTNKIVGGCGGDGTEDRTSPKKK